VLLLPTRAVEYEVRLSGGGPVDLPRKELKDTVVDPVLVPSEKLTFRSKDMV
jgi:hypothetical protein